jgi:hypothetical protein
MCSIYVAKYITLHQLFFLGGFELLSINIKSTIWVPAYRTVVIVLKRLESCVCGAEKMKNSEFKTDLINFFRIISDYYSSASIFGQSRFASPHRE